MTKTKITEITEKFDKDGKLIEKITRVEETTDDGKWTPKIDRGDITISTDDFPPIKLL